MVSEKHIIACRRHWSAYVVTGLIIAIFAMAGFESLFQSESFGQAVGSFLVACLIIILLYTYASASHKRYYIAMTESEIVGHKGVFFSKRLSVPLSKVQHISIENGIIGKILGYHTITLDNAGTGLAFRFSKMAKAEEFVVAVQKRI